MLSLPWSITIILNYSPHLDSFVVGQVIIIWIKNKKVNFKYSIVLMDFYTVNILGKIPHRHSKKTLPSLLLVSNSTKGNGILDSTLFILPMFWPLGKVSYKECVLFWIWLLSLNIVFRIPSFLLGLVCSILPLHISLCEDPILYLSILLLGETWCIYSFGLLWFYTSIGKNMHFTCAFIPRRRIAKSRVMYVIILSKESHTVIQNSFTSLQFQVTLYESSNYFTFLPIFVSLVLCFCQTVGYRVSA